MTLNEFKKSTKNENPPFDNELLKAMWYETKGDWDKAHKIVQDIEGKNASWIHAYLHRKEGDLSNASYWYSRAGKTTPSMKLNEEWELITLSLLELS